MNRKGCTCRKTNCLKKYCECFHAGIVCGVACKCDDCKNTEFVLKNKEKGRIELFHKHFWRDEEGGGFSEEGGGLTEEGGEIMDVRAKIEEEKDKRNERPRRKEEDVGREEEREREEGENRENRDNSRFSNEIRLKKEGGSEMKFSMISSFKKGIRKTRTEAREVKKREGGRKKTGIERSLFF